MSILSRENTLEIFENFQKLDRKTKEGAVNWNSSYGDNKLFTNTASFIRTSVEFKKLSVFLRNLLKIKGTRFNVKKYFENIKSSLKTLDTKNYKIQKEKIVSMREKSKKNNQIALIEKLNRQETRMNKELEIVKHGFGIFIDENKIVEFSKHATRELKLDWIKNFTRVIPEDVQEKLHKIDAADIFDNYVVLHYDPKDTGSELTEKEKEKKKDPILFGVVECSRRLYYIGDWIDEYCDLTLDVLIETLSLTENDIDLKLNNNILK